MSSDFGRVLQAGKLSGGNFRIVIRGLKAFGGSNMFLYFGFSTHPAQELVLGMKKKRTVAASQKF